MKKVNEIAVINSVELSDSLMKWNEDNEAFRVRLVVSYTSSSAKEDEEEGVLTLADFEKEGASISKLYTCLVNFDSLLSEDFSEGKQKKALKALTEKFKGKKARFSTFDMLITELSNGKGSVINNGKKAYTSLSNTYLGKVDDEEGEFKKLAHRLNAMLDDEFEFGELEDEE